MYSFSGRKWKSSEYQKFEALCKMHLRKSELEIPEHGDLEIHLTFGISSRFDLDNSLKSFIDILQDRYNFNDNRIIKIVAEKKRVKKGNEFIDFELFLKL